MERRSRIRVANACDLCKQRKTKCSGAQPCAYCIRRREPGNCRYTPRRLPALPRPRSEHTAGPSPSSSAQSIAQAVPSGYPRFVLDPAISAAAPDDPIVASVEPTLPSHPGQLPRDAIIPASEEHELTDVPREARLLCDAQGKLLFIGDCAPLSFFQTVRRLVTTCVDANAFAPETSGYSALENVYSRSGASGSYGGEPPLVKADIGPAVAAYLEVTAGLIDLFDNNRLAQDLSAWTQRGIAHGEPVDVSAAVNYLILAIGYQKSDEAIAQRYFDYARNVAFASLSGNLGVASVQAFMLITFYGLGACQINGAFLFFGIAARAAYSIGIHRTAVNARFDPEVHRQRDRLWKSLRVLDLFLSTSMGRPPATSDVDCTVPYREQDDAGHEVFDLLNASAQIFLVIEAVVVEVYSRRKISPRLTEGISRELREWSTRWLQRLKDVVDGTSPVNQPGMVNGACQVLSSYYYAAILVSRPFLMVELHRRLSEESSGAGNTGLTNKSKLADACIDAAILMVEPIQSAIERGLMTRRAPVIVSWLFAASLVLGVGLLGGFGRILEKHCRASIAALEFFAEADTHAVQYSLIAKSLLATAQQYLERREVQERRRRTESSSQLFGLLPRTGCGSEAEEDGSGTTLLGQGQGSSESPQKDHPDGADKADPGHVGDDHEMQMSLEFQSAGSSSDKILPTASDFSLMGGLLDADAAEQTFGSLNLFPLLETDGHIDLANYF